MLLALHARATVLALALATFGCAAVREETRVAPLANGPEEPRLTPPSGTALAPQKPSLTRESLRVVAAGGVTRVLELLEFAEQPVFRDGRFVGLRLLARHDNGASRVTIDVQPGDIITAVNGVAPRTPEDLFTILHALPLAPSLVIAIVREGKPLTLSVPIVEGPNDKILVAPTTR